MTEATLGNVRAQFPADPGNPFLADYPSLLLTAGPIRIPTTNDQFVEKMLVTLTCANGTLSAYVTAEQLDSWSEQFSRGALALRGLLVEEKKLIVPG
jgi:hypothetical protein